MGIEDEGLVGRADRRVRHTLYGCRSSSSLAFSAAAMDSGVGGGSSRPRRPHPARQRPEAQDQHGGPDGRNRLGTRQDHLRGNAGHRFAPIATFAAESFKLPARRRPRRGRISAAAPRMSRPHARPRNAVSGSAPHLPGRVRGGQLLGCGTRAQSAAIGVSYTIANLEEQLGGLKLFDRAGRRPVLTEAGIRSSPRPARCRSTSMRCAPRLPGCWPGLEPELAVVVDVMLPTGDSGRHDGGVPCRLPDREPAPLRRSSGRRGQARSRQDLRGGRERPSRREHRRSRQAA